MRNRILAAVVLALVLPVTAWAQGQPIVPKIQITGVRVGFPTAGQGSGFKAGAWTPVYVDLTAGLDRIGRADGSVFVQAEDSDDLQNYYVVPLPQMESKEAVTVLTYTRTATAGSEILVTVRSPEGRDLARAKPLNQGPVSYFAFGPSSWFYLTAGANASGLKKAVLAKFDTKKGQPGAMQGGGMQGGMMPPGGAPPPGGPPQPGNPNPNQPDNGDVGDDFEDSAHSHCFAYAGSNLELPTRWFGYGGVDVLFLHTGNEQFTKDLLEDGSNRKEALAEWVRRGGRVVISVGRNQQLAKGLLEKMGVIGVTPTGVVQRSRLQGVEKWTDKSPAPFVGTPRKDEKGKPLAERAPIDLTRLDIEPRRGVEVLAKEAAEGDDKTERPSIVQAPCGLGRVVLVAFDLERGPFTDWAGQGALWDKLQTTMQPRDAKGQQAGNMNPGMVGGPGMGGWGGSNPNEVGSRMLETLQWFDDVPVISFGWVALFILVYIVIVGPLDYFFLKKVVKRLELTWITFPAVVLVVSAVAYFSAYYLKGNDLRINKLDVVDVVAELDAEGSESHGTWAHGATWFTLFSPRIQNYTVGIEPNFPKWGPDAAADKSAPRNPNSTLVTWFGKPEDTWGGTGRASSPSLFRRAYDYAPDASGLTGVPIQVWSSKSFAASWQERLTDQTPLFSADLTHPPGNPQLLSGTVTNHLPVKLLDVTLFYRGKAYTIGELPPGRKRVDDLVQNPKEMEQWFQDTQFLVNNYQYQYGPYGNRQGKPQTNAAAALTKLLMFNEANDKGNQGTRLDNALLRPLDESWRLRPGREEVVVVGKVTSESPYDPNGGPAEKVTQDAVTATRLWLGSLPGTEKARPPLVGIVKQDTYVRVFLPIAPAEVAKKEAEK